MDRTPKQSGIVSVPPAQQILDALAGPVAVLDQTGTIIAVNQAWLGVARASGLDGATHIGTNYLAVCDQALGADAPCARSASAGIRSVLAGAPFFSIEYPCHSPQQPKWFQLCASRLDCDGAPYVVVAHHDITDRVLIEQERQGLLAKAHRYQEQLKMLAKMSTSIVGLSSPELVFEQVTDEARQIIGAHWAATHTVPYALWPSRPIILSVSDRSREVPRMALERYAAAIYSHVTQAGAPLRLVKAELDLWPDLQGIRSQESDFLPMNGILAVPITSPQGGLLGVLVLSDKINGEFTADDEAILVQLAQIASVSIENAAKARAEREVRERLSATHEHASIGIGETDAEGRFLTVNKGLSAITGYTRGELLTMSIFDLTHPDNTETERDCYGRHVSGDLQTYAHDKLCSRKDGTHVWVHVSSAAVFDEAGRFQYSVRVIQDIDRRKRIEERQALLVRELHHRVRNTLAVVEALAGATSRTATSMREFTRSFSARIAALAKTQTLLTEDYWQTASLKEMLLCELQPFEERRRERFRLEGPPVDLAADIAIPLSMAFHELTANAARYGALSVRTGSVRVSWDLAFTEGRRELHLRWVEENGAPVQPPAHSGFGLALLHRVLPAQCQARVQVDFDPRGFRCEIRVPLVVRRLVPDY